MLPHCNRKKMLENSKRIKTSFSKYTGLQPGGERVQLPWRMLNRSLNFVQFYINHAWDNLLHYKYRVSTRSKFTTSYDENKALQKKFELLCFARNQLGLFSYWYGLSTWNTFPLNRLESDLTLSIFRLRLRLREEREWNRSIVNNLQ